MVTPEDAERIALAQSDGPPMLTLRNPLDVEPTKTNWHPEGGAFSPRGAAGAGYPESCPPRFCTNCPAAADSSNRLQG